MAGPLPSSGTAGTCYSRMAGRDTSVAPQGVTTAVGGSWMEISNAVLWLASDEARYVTGITLPVDAGSTAPFKIPNL